jgi:hypothetical protein
LLSLPSLIFLRIKRHKTIILPVVLRETWLVKPMVEHRLRVSENRALRRLFRLKRVAMAEG